MGVSAPDACGGLPFYVLQGCGVCLLNSQSPPWAPFVGLGPSLSSAFGITCAGLLLSFLCPAQPPLHERGFLPFLGLSTAP